MQQTARPSPRGFTLIELMVAVVVVGILAAVAYPTFMSHLQRSRRADAMAVLSSVTQAQERFRSNRSTFTTSMTELFGSNTPSTTKYYQIAITALANDPDLRTGYKVSATPLTGPQASDTQCATMSIEVRGASVSYTATGTEAEKCWSR